MAKIVCAIYSVVEGHSMTDISYYNKLVEYSNSIYL